MKIFNKKESGFTLVELVVVVAVVGVLAVVATPKIVGVAGDAREAQLAGVLGELTKANANNFVLRQAGDPDGRAVATCAQAYATLEGGFLPVGYTSASSADTDTFIGANDHITSASPDYSDMLEGITYNCSISTVKVPTKTGVFIAVGSPDPD